MHTDQTVWRDKLCSEGQRRVTRELSNCILCVSLEVTPLQGLQTAPNHCSHPEQKPTRQREEGVHILFLQTQGPWLDVRFRFHLAAEYRIPHQPRLQSDGRPGCQRCLPAACLLISHSPGTRCASFGTLRLRTVHPLPSLCFFFLFWEAKIMLRFKGWQEDERERENRSVDLCLVLSGSQKKHVVFGSSTLYLRHGLNTWNSYHCLIPDSTGIRQDWKPALLAHSSAVWAGEG